MRTAGTMRKLWINTGKTVVIIWILAYLFDGRWTANRSTWPNFKGWWRR